MTTATAVPTGHARRNLAIVAVAAVTALGLVFFMISSVTGAAWTDTTENAGNVWQTGTVSLTDNDAEAAMFSIAADDDMVPGTVIQNTITVTNASTVPLDVRMYGEGLADTGGLGQYLNLKVGTTLGAEDVYTGTLAAFGTVDAVGGGHVTFATGTPLIDMAASGTQIYYFWVELDADTPTEFQTKTAGIDFVWEGQTQ